MACQIGHISFVATCPSCGNRIRPDQVMCTSCAMSVSALSTRTHERTRHH